jgi:2-hydroxychromene-2-carboxylate isomerase
MTRRVDVYFSLLSPWAHLGHAPLLEIAKRRGAEIGWRPMPLLKLFADTGGVPLAQRPAPRRRYRDLELLRWADRRGRPLKLRPAFWPFDPSLADRAAIALIQAEADPALYLQAGFRAAWEEDRDLADRAVVAAVLDAQGFDAEATLAAAESPAAHDAYAANHAAALEAGAFGSPAYVLDGELFWGQDRLDMIDEALASGRAPYHVAV